MRYFWLSFKAIFIKDIVVEFRSKQVLPTMIILGMLIVWTLRIAAESALITHQIIAPVALWIAFLFSGLLVQERSFAAEQHNNCIASLLMAPIDEGTIYFAKLLVNIIMLCIFELIIVPVVLIMFKVSVADNLLNLILVLLLGNIGISSVGTLFSAIVQLARTRGSLLSILVLAVLLPMMIPATFALLLIFGGLDPNLHHSGTMGFVGTFKNALGYMIAFDAVFVTASWLLFPFAVKD